MRRRGALQDPAHPHLGRVPLWGVPVGGLVVVLRFRFRDLQDPAVHDEFGRLKAGQQFVVELGEPGVEDRVLQTGQVPVAGWCPPDLDHAEMGAVVPTGAENTLFSPASTGRSSATYTVTSLPVRSPSVRGASSTSSTCTTAMRGSASTPVRLFAPASSTLPRKTYWAARTHSPTGMARL